MHSEWDGGVASSVRRVQRHAYRQAVQVFPFRFLIFISIIAYSYISLQRNSKFPILQSHPVMLASASSCGMPSFPAFLPSVPQTVPYGCESGAKWGDHLDLTSQSSNNGYFAILRPHFSFAKCETAVRPLSALSAHDPRYVSHPH